MHAEHCVAIVLGMLKRKRVCVPCTTAASAREPLRFCESCVQVRCAKALGCELGMHKFPVCLAHGRVRRKLESGREALVDTLRMQCAELLSDFEVVLEQEEAVQFTHALHA